MWPGGLCLPTEPDITNVSVSRDDGSVTFTTQTWSHNTTIPLLQYHTSETGEIDYDSYSIADLNEVISTQETDENYGSIGETEEHFYTSEIDEDYYNSQEYYNSEIDQEMDEYYDYTSETERNYDYTSETDEDYDTTANTDEVDNPNTPFSHMDKELDDYKAFVTLKRLINEATLLLLNTPSISHLFNQTTTTTTPHHYTTQELFTIVSEEIKRNETILRMIDTAETEMEKHPKAARLFHQTYSDLNKGLVRVRFVRSLDKQDSLMMTRNAIVASGFALTIINMIIGIASNIYMTVNE
ncbi:hypothetical protein Pmani_038855 [Petrolisthes manimaculis]|uniref:Uncharacterized protein n=1 Tax=Petrolisthes manimaculis TaxID=1843537 RepID=A0AAE1NFE6_9EUCA|nr:hypothetical protein Pmani_038855 [Petrolisthes manimaculis]